MIQFIKNQISDSIIIKENILKSREHLNKIEDISKLVIRQIKDGNKLLLCGNGGSAADAQHIATEFISKFRVERRGLPAIALTTNTSILSAISNDYTYERVFERQVEALGQPGDVIIGISTSGNSKNITRALSKARDMNIITIGLLGKDGGENKSFCDLSIIIDSNDTPRIQESHIMIGHIICDIVERGLFGNEG